MYFQVPLHATEAGGAGPLTKDFINSCVYFQVPLHATEAGGAGPLTTDFMNSCVYFQVPLHAAEAGGAGPGCAPSQGRGEPLGVPVLRQERLPRAHWGQALLNGQRSQKFSASSFYNFAFRQTCPGFSDSQISWTGFREYWMIYRETMVLYKSFSIPWGWVIRFVYR